MLQRTGLLLALLVMCALSACADDTQERLQAMVAQANIKEVVVNEEKIIATCLSGEKVEISADELERNFLGMAKTSKVTTIAKNIVRDCEDKDSKKRQEEAMKARLTDMTKQLSIDTTGLDEAAIKKKICEKLTEQLPKNEVERTVQGAKNTNDWGCDPPPPPPPVTTGAWAVEIGKAQGKKPATSYLRLENENKDKITVRCVGKKPDFYLQPQQAVKKGTKTIDVKVDGAKKPAKWKVKPSTDGKALFFVDTKAAFKAMGPANQLAFVVPGPKKPATVTFDIKGYGDAAKQLPAGCK